MQGFDLAILIHEEAGVDETVLKPPLDGHGLVLSDQIPSASEVSLVAEVQDRLARQTIEDLGPGIREDRLEAVLLPGVREDERVPGDGFGLTIVAELASLYGGTFEIKSVAQRGTRAILHLPRAVQPTK